MKTPFLDKIIEVIKSVIKLPRRKRRGRPCKYKQKTIAVMFAVMMLKKIVHFKSMHQFLITNPEIAKILGFNKSIPDRSTLSRRFKGIYAFIKQQVKNLGSLLIGKNITKARIVSIDSTLHEACGPVWHKKDKAKGVIPDKLRNLDKEAEWGFSRYKQWVYGYKTHLVSTSSPENPAIPIDCEITQANQADTRVAHPLVQQSSFSKTQYLLADKAYDDKNLRALCESKKIRLLGPLQHKPGYSRIRMAYLIFYRSQKGRKIYAQRGKTIEPLFGYIKELFSTAKLKMQGFKNVRTYLSLTIWIYQILIYVNYLLHKPLRRLKYLVCAV